MTDEEKIIARILDVIPPRSFELTTFLSLFRVRFSEKTKTACVTCGESPELLLNKDFKKNAKFYLCLFSASWCGPCRRELLI